MGYTIPGWLDEVLDFIGIKFPNVDEDDYREMATAMRDFAGKFEGHSGDAHQAVSRILLSSQGWAVDAMEQHWNKVRVSHLDKLPELARLLADACDILADIIFALKTKAEVELGVMAASVGVSAGLAVVTGGLSALIGAAEVAAMRQLVKRLVDEAVDRIVDEVLAKITEPINAKLEAMVADMVLDLAEGAFSVPPADGGTSGPGKPGPAGLHLASAGGGSTGYAPVTYIDHVALVDGADKVSAHGGELRQSSAAHLSRARSAFGRSKGRDPFTQVFDGVLHGALKGSEKALGKIAKHVTETVPAGVKATSKTLKGTDHDVEDILDKIKNKKGGSGDTPMYLLDADGSVRRLLPDGSAHPLRQDDTSGVHSVLNGGQAWHPWHSTDKKGYGVKDGGENAPRVTSEKIPPGSSDLARATQIARYHNAHERPEIYKRGGANYASLLFDDDADRRFILVGTSDPVHSERILGYPILHSSEQAHVNALYTEREPCQETNMYCDQWLAQHFDENMDVTHSAKYDQDEKRPDSDTELSKWKQDREHRAYVKWLHEQWAAHGVDGGATSTMIDLSPSENRFVP
ncbi:nucleic acid/nucleotide deaminase domain-containing protein [Streptomyces sp. NBC_01218]|uniref:nucleic acid/nucleotide deaminase domain-containing protein n=1 Tax=Streptomyces sp. NBC_01218 TaxID=2903780 RepID=UPI002E12C0C0